MLEITEAARHGLAPRIDDACVGQNQMDEPDMPEVIRHLIDEMRVAGAVRAGGSQIGLPEAPEFLRRHAGENGRIARIVIVAVAAHQFSDIRFWNEPTKGGHFAAFEQPAQFVDDVRAFFRTVR